MDWQADSEIECPYCGEILTLLLDYSAGNQSYVEDCHVCCQPILIEVRIRDLEDISITARRENE
ncbi:MAG: CPXCG motif-containing cysteine-rich protein [Candidatus Sericytochromatia bacterium]